MEGGYLDGGYLDGGYIEGGYLEGGRCPKGCHAIKGYKAQPKKKVVKKKKKVAKFAIKPCAAGMKKHCVKHWGPAKKHRCRKFENCPAGATLYGDNMIPYTVGATLYGDNVIPYAVGGACPAGCRTVQHNAKKKAAAKRNPWMAFLRNYRKANPHMNQADLVKAASVEYRKM